MDQVIKAVEFISIVVSLAAVAYKGIAYATKRIKYNELRARFDELLEILKEKL